MFAPINPKVPATRAADNSLRWSAKGLSLNTANNTTWTGTQTFSNAVNFNSSTYFNSVTANNAAFYNYGTFYNSGTFETATLTATGLITSNEGFRAALVATSHYESPYAYSYQLSYYPVVPYSIGGNASDGGYLSDDGYGNISSSYYGIIATIDYSSGYVTDVTSLTVSTTYISYSSGSATYAEISYSGRGAFADSIGNTVVICDDNNALTVGGTAVFNSGIADNSQVPAIEVNGRALYDFNSYTAISWNDRYLYNSSNALVLDWASTVKIGDSSNYTEFDSTGHQTMVGTAQPWDDLRVEPVVKQAAGVGVPSFEKYFDDSAGTSKGVFLYSFTDESVAANEKEIFFTAQMPHSWNSGAINIHVHFTPSATVNSSDIRWGLEYCMKEPTATFGDTTIIYSSTTLVPDDANITAGKHYIATFSGITPDTTQDGLSTILICRLFRNSSNGADTYTNKVGLLYVDIHYQLARLGSNDEYTA